MRSAIDVKEFKLKTGSIAVVCVMDRLKKYDAVPVVVVEDHNEVTMAVGGVILWQLTVANGRS